MRVRLLSDRYETTMYLPADAYELRDALDKLRLYDSSEVVCRVEECDTVGKLEGMRFKDDLYMINLLAQRLEWDHIDAKIQHAMIGALIDRSKDRSVEELLKVTYTTDLPVYPCRDCMEYGEIVVDNDWLDELKHVPDEAVPYLDMYAIGLEMAARENGIFINDLYVIPDNYEPPEIEITLGKPDRSFFRLLIAPKGSDAEKQGQWFSLLQEGGMIANYAQNMGMELDDLEIADFKSALPDAAPPDASIDNVYVYQSLANKLRDSLTHAGVVVLKAIMATKPMMNAAQINELINNVHRYDFDCFAASADGYGFAYIDRLMPTTSMLRAIGDCDFTEIGNALLNTMNCHITEYGAISEMDHKLYSLVSSLDETEDEDCGEQPLEDNDIEMG